MIQLLWRDVDVDGKIIPTSLTEAETVEIQRLANGQQVLEIGSAYGYSAILMAFGGAQHVLAVDPHGGQWSFAMPDSLAVMQRNLEIFDVQVSVSMVLARSEIIMPALYDSGARFGFVFVDGEHAEPVVDHDLTWALKLVAPGGVIAFHDFGEVTCGGVEAALSKRRPEGPTRIIDSLWILEVE
jgi:predicted O-methyltransferase YrrM